MSFYTVETIKSLGLVQELLTFYCTGQRQWQRWGESEGVPPSWGRTSLTLSLYFQFALLLFLTLFSFWELLMSDCWDPYIIYHTMTLWMLLPRCLGGHALPAWSSSPLVCCFLQFVEITNNMFLFFFMIFQPCLNVKNFMLLNFVFYLMFQAVEVYLWVCLKSWQNPHNKFLQSHVKGLGLSLVLQCIGFVEIMTCIKMWKWYCTNFNLSPQQFWNLLCLWNSYHFIIVVGILNLTR